MITVSLPSDMLKHPVVGSERGRTRVRASRKSRCSCYTPSNRLRDPGLALSTRRENVLPRETLALAWSDPESIRKAIASVQARLHDAPTLA